MVVASRALIFRVLLGLVIVGDNCEGTQVASSLEAIKAQGANQAESFGQVSATTKGFDPSTKSPRVSDSSSCKTSFKTNLLGDYDVLAVPLLSCLAKHRSEPLWELQPSLEASSKDEESKPIITQDKKANQKWRRDQSKFQQAGRRHLGPLCEGSLGQYYTSSKVAQNRRQWCSESGAAGNCHVTRHSSTTASVATTTGGLNSGRCRCCQHPSPTGGIETCSCRKKECIARSAVSNRRFGERGRSGHAFDSWSTQSSFQIPKADQDDEVQDRGVGHRVEKVCTSSSGKISKTSAAVSSTTTGTVRTDPGETEESAEAAKRDPNQLSTSFGRQFGDAGGSRTRSCRSLRGHVSNAGEYVRYRTGRFGGRSGCQPQQTCRGSIQQKKSCAYITPKSSENVLEGQNPYKAEKGRSDDSRGAGDLNVEFFFQDLAGICGCGVAAGKVRKSVSFDSKVEVFTFEADKALVTIADGDSVSPCPGDRWYDALEPTVTNQIEIRAGWENGVCPPTCPDVECIDFLGKDGGPSMQRRDGPVLHFGNHKLSVDQIFEDLNFFQGIEACVDEMQVPSDAVEDGTALMHHGQAMRGGYQTGDFGPSLDDIAMLRSSAQNDDDAAIQGDFAAMLQEALHHIERLETVIIEKIHVCRSLAEHVFEDDQSLLQLQPPSSSSTADHASHFWSSKSDEAPCPGGRWCAESFASVSMVGMGDGSLLQHGLGESAFVPNSCHTLGTLDEFLAWIDIAASPFYVKSIDPVDVIVPSVPHKVPLCLEWTIPQSVATLTHSGRNNGMFSEMADLFHPWTPECWPLPDGLKLHESTAKALEHAANQVPVQHMQTLLYVDGSATNHGCGWAVAIIDVGCTCCGNIVANLRGVIFDQVSLDKDCYTWWGAKHGDNIDAELSGCLVAILWYLANCAPDHDVTLCPDLHYSLELLQGKCASTSDRPLSQMVSEFGAMAVDRGLKSMHVRAHQGWEWNELVDRLAVFAADPAHCTPQIDIPRLHDLAMRPEEISLLSMHPSLLPKNMISTLPTFQDETIKQKVGSSQGIYLDNINQIGTVHDLWIDLQALSYNVLSIRANDGVAQQEIGRKADSKTDRLDDQFHKQGFHVACLQETRTDPGCHSSTNYAIFSGAEKRGKSLHFGCEIWIHKSKAWSVGKSNCGACPDLRTIQVVHSSSRCLVIQLKVAGQSWTIISAHAPSVGPAHTSEEVQSWWKGFSGDFKRWSQGSYVVVGIDANAPLGARTSTAVDDHGAEDSTMTGDLF